MNKSIFAIIGVLVVVISAVLVAAQAVPSIPATFSVNLNQLPSAQSSNQKFFGCRYYTGDITLRDVKVYEVRGSALSPTVEASVSYWIGDSSNTKRCAQTITRNFTLAASASSNAMVTNLQTAINTAFLVEAQANNQGITPRTIIATGS